MSIASSFSIIKFKRKPVKPKQISITKAPVAIDFFSQGCIAGDILFLSGQGGLEPERGTVSAGKIQEQAEGTIQNISTHLNKVGLDFSNVVKTTCYLFDMEDFTEFNEVYSKYFITNPARTCVVSKQLPLGILCEVEVIAHLK